MKRYLHGFAMCQSMFCAIPCPWKVWDEEARDQMLLFLPLVGLEIGLIWAALSWLAGYLDLSPAVRGVVLCAYPFLVTGSIHLDGFMDVTDAVKSCRDMDRRRAILKDPHVGSFAVIGLALLLLAQFAFFTAADNGGVLMLIPVVSRCCSALAVKGLKPMSTSQYAARKTPAGHMIALTVMLCAALVAGFLFSGRAGLALLGCLAGYGFALGRGYRSLGGMNGDISGYALTIGELWGAAVCAIL